MCILLSAFSSSKLYCYENKDPMCDASCIILIRVYMNRIEKHRSHARSSQERYDSCCSDKAYIMYVVTLLPTDIAIPCPYKSGLP